MLTSIRFRTRPLLLFSVVLGLALVVPAAGPGGTASTAAQEPERPPATPPREAPPGHRDVRSIRLLIPDGGRVAWSAQGNRIAYDKAGEDGLYDLYTASADGAEERCVTCNVYELRNAHAFNPDWAPGGDWLIFQVQDVAKRLHMGVLELSSPLRAAHSDLWVAPPEGRRAWQITRQGERGGAPVDPHFAYEGGRILWSERVAAKPGPWGSWVVRVAEISFKRGTPHLGKVKTYEPAPGLVLAQGFTPDDQGFLYGAGSFDRGLSFHRFRFDGKSSEPVPPDGGITGEAARPVPGRDSWAVASGLGLPPRGGHGLPRRRDVWLAGDGRRERLTYFNDPSSEHPLGEALIDDLEWSPTGDRFLVHVVSTGDSEGAERTDRPSVREGIWLVVMDPSYRR
jgi:hypothetical protein